MQHRKFTADQIFDGCNFLPLKSVVVVDEKGAIKDIIHEYQAGEGVECFNGIITPGLVNSHCHLELSYLKGKIPSNTGLINFLLSVIERRRKQENIDEIKSAIVEAEIEMYQNGTVGIGDIANTTQALDTKRKSALLWNTFIEVINFKDESLAAQLQHNKNVLQQHLEHHLPATLTPHAPYTVSSRTFCEINVETKSGIVSIHNQESAAEDELFKTGSGDFLKLYAAISNGGNPFAVSGESSVQTYLPYFTQQQKILLVHNTYISEEDILFIKEYEATTGIGVVFCLCPNANLYIENRLPPVDLLLQYNCSIVLGTDSYSSNWQLSIAKEMKTIMDYFPTIPVEAVLRWGTSGGARFFNWEALGKIEKGKKPGLVLLETVQSKITGNSKRIV